MEAGREARPPGRPRWGVGHALFVRFTDCKKTSRRTCERHIDAACPLPFACCGAASPATVRRRRECRGVEVGEVLHRGARDREGLPRLRRPELVRVDEARDVLEVGVEASWPRAQDGEGEEPDEGAVAGRDEGSKMEEVD